MSMFTKITENTFNELQTEAGILLKRFDPKNPVPPADEDIICATTGGIQATCTPSFSDWGEDVDNVKNNLLELKHVDGWECTLGFTALNVTPEVIRMALGMADTNSEGGIDTTVPRNELKDTDFSDVWWVGDRSDGKFVAVQLKNALSTGGFSLQTTKNGKGQIAVTLTGHVSIVAQDEVPMNFYTVSKQI